MEHWVVRIIKRGERAQDMGNQEAETGRVLGHEEMAA
jgi:predicted transcriptional regulator